MQLRPRVAAAAVVALVAGVLLASPAQASRTDVPDDAVVRIDGRGYGHGHGMSQYGAQGAAQRGLGYARIAEFYYPGTSWGTATGPVRVRITADTTRHLVVLAKRGLKVRDLGRKKTWTLPDNGARRWRLTANKKNRTIVQFRRPGTRWKLWKRLKGVGQFAGKGPKTLVTPSGRTAYRGRLRAAVPRPGQRARETVNILPLEQYLRGVVPLEIPASWHPEAVRAQAVAARTYAAFERAHPLARHYQICDTTQCQVYGGASAEHPASDQAIRATRHRVLTADGGPAFTQFHSSSGGWTSTGSRPYLVQQRDPYDGWAGNPVHQWQVTTDDRRIEQAWPALGNLRRVVVDQRNGAGAMGGRVVRMRLLGSRGDVSLSGDEFRSTLGLRSNWFTVSAQARVAPAQKPERGVSP